MHKKTYKVPIAKLVSGTAYIKAYSLEEAIDKARHDIRQGFLSYECDFDDYFDEDVGYEIATKNETTEDIFAEIEEHQDNLEEIATDEFGQEVLEFTEKHPYNLSEEEYSLIQETLKETRLDNEIYIEQFYLDGKRIDIFFDEADFNYMTLKEGVKLLMQATCKNEYLEGLKEVLKAVESKERF